MNRLGWAKTHLVKALLLTSSEWSKFQITQRGKELLGTNPEALKVKEMKAMYPEFKEFMENKKKTKQQKIKSPANLIVPVPTDDGLATAYFGSKAVRMSPSDLAKVLACMS
jgi:restriction system protein